MFYRFVMATLCPRRATVDFVVVGPFLRIPGVNIIQHVANMDTARSVVSGNILAVVRWHHPMRLVPKARLLALFGPELGLFSCRTTPLLSSKDIEENKSKWGSNMYCKMSANIEYHSCCNFLSLIFFFKFNQRVKYSDVYFRCTS